MSKGSTTRPGTGYSDGWDRVFGEAPVIKPMKPHSITNTLGGFIRVNGYELVKSSAIHCADDMATKAERMIEALCLYEVETTWDDLNESMRALRSAIYEYRKRMEK